MFGKGEVSGSSDGRLSDGDSDDGGGDESLPSVP